MLLSAAGIMAVNSTVALVVGISLAALGLSAVMGAQQNREHEAILRAATQGRSVRVRPGTFWSPPALSYTADGVGYQVALTGYNGKGQNHRTKVDAAFRGGSPSVYVGPGGSADLGELFGSEDLQIGVPNFDQRWSIRGHPASAAGMLNEDTRRLVDELLRERVRHHDGAVTVEGHADHTVVRIQVEHWIEAPDELREHLERCQALVRAFQAARLAPWVRAAAAHGLTLQELDGLPLVHGVVEDAPIRAYVELRSSGWRTCVSVDLRCPPGLRVVHKEGAREDMRPRRVGNPVVDATLAIGGDDEDALRALFADEARTAAVLDVVHAHPGSTISEGMAILAVPGFVLEALPGLVDKVVALARAWRSP